MRSLLAVAATWSPAGSWLPREPTMWLRSWNFQPHSLTSRMSWLSKAKDVINHTLLTKSPWKPQRTGLEKLLDTRKCAGAWRKVGSDMAYELHISSCMGHPMHLFIYILYNKLTNKFSWLLWLILADGWIQEGGYGKSYFTSHSMEGSLVRLNSSLWDLCYFQVDSVRSEGNGGSPISRHPEDSARRWSQVLGVTLR